MTGVRIETRIEATEAAAAFAALQRVMADPTPVLRAIGTGILSTTRDRFFKEADPEGNRWKPLNPGYAAGKRGPGILREGGGSSSLMDSLSFQTTTDAVEVGTNRPYGAIHQFGGEIKPTKGDRLVFSIGGSPVFARSVTIPARPFLGFGPAEIETTLDVIEGALDRAMGAR